MNINKNIKKGFVIVMATTSTTLAFADNNDRGNSLGISSESIRNLWL